LLNDYESRVYNENIHCYFGTFACDTCTTSCISCRITNHHVIEATHFNGILFQDATASTRRRRRGTYHGLNVSCFIVLQSLVTKNVDCNMTASVFSTDEQRLMKYIRINRLHGIDTLELVCTLKHFIESQTEFKDSVTDAMCLL
jgi:hypothetical protein